MKPFRYSALDTATKCLTKYKYQYLEQLKVDTMDSIDLEFGTAIHLGLETILVGGNFNQVFELYWDSLKDKKFVRSNSSWEELKDIGLIFLSRFNRLHKKHYKVEYLERHMKGKIGDHEIEGTADVIGKYKGIKSIIDFKTSFREYPKEKLLYNPQMPIYATLAKQNFGYEVEQLVYVVFIKSEKRIQVITQKLNQTLLELHTKNVIMLCDDLAVRTEYPKNFNSCMMGSYKCGFFNTCYGDAKNEDSNS